MLHVLFLGLPRHLLLEPSCVWPYSHSHLHLYSHFHLHSHLHLHLHLHFHLHLHLHFPPASCANLRVGRDKKKALSGRSQCCIPAESCVLTVVAIDTDDTACLTHPSKGMPQFDPEQTPPFFSLVPNIIGPPAKWSKEAAGMGAVDIAYGAGMYIIGYAGGICAAYTPSILRHVPPSPPFLPHT